MLATDSVGQKRTASDCCVREKTLPATAGVSGCRVRFNRQLHPEEKKWISEKEAAYAKKYSLTAEQAHNELTTQANLQVQNGSPGTWNERASAFLGQAHGMLAADGKSGPGYMFYATPEQKANVDMYAKYYAGGTGANRPSQSQIGASVSREQAYRDAFRTGTLVAAGGAATVATGGVIAALPGAPIFSSGGALGTGALASPVGTGAISAGINAGAQYYQNGTVNPIDVAIAAISGGAGAYGGLGWNVFVNGVGGATGTAINNAVYGRNDSIIGSGITSGALSAIGYTTGKAAESWINSSLRPTINNANGWATSGVWSGSGWNLIQPNAMGVIGGSIGGGITQEAVTPIVPTPSIGGSKK
ncbi:hypothetical protein [Paraburkholderia hayleyella]|uniref:hypothetical protein n=1 Tax=Paraburkholderia hayleyella TaxID=2152889 RepID=UPI00129149EA|nr:hypothetical protein [Paraburkholderia hayleyella]